MNDPASAVQATIYLNEADQWHHRPRHLELPKFLRVHRALRGIRHMGGHPLIVREKMTIEGEAD